MTGDKEKSRSQEAERQKREDDKELDRELDDTFPASDPPSTTRPGGHKGDD